MNSANQGRWGDPWPSTFTGTTSDGKHHPTGSKNATDVLKVEADFSHWNDNKDSCKPRMDTSLLHVGDELKFTDVDGRAYILKVIREAEE